MRYFRAKITLTKTHPYSKSWEEYIYVYIESGVFPTDKKIYSIAKTGDKHNKARQIMSYEVSHIDIFEYLCFEDFNDDINTIKKTELRLGKINEIFSETSDYTKSDHVLLNKKSLNNGTAILYAIMSVGKYEERIHISEVFIPHNKQIKNFYRNIKLINVEELSVEDIYKIISDLKNKEYTPSEDYDLECDVMIAEMRYKESVKYKLNRAIKNIKEFVECFIFFPPILLMILSLMLVVMGILFSNLSHCVFGH